MNMQDQNSGNGNRPNETPEEQQSRQEGSGYNQQQEQQQQGDGSDATYREQQDVNQPDRKEFPAEGPARADFEARPHGRTTGRMIDHEPGLPGSI